MPIAGAPAEVAVFLCAPRRVADLKDTDVDRLLERADGGPHRNVDARARRIVREAGTDDTLKVLAVMTRGIKEEFRYGARFEKGTKTAAQTVELGTGTRRDTAVPMMEALRSYGLLGAGSDRIAARHFIAEKCH